MKLAELEEQVKQVLLDILVELVVLALVVQVVSERKVELVVLAEMELKVAQVELVA